MTRIPEPHAKRIFLPLLGLGLIVALILASFIRVENRVSGICLVSPATRWTLSERRAGSYESKTVNLVTGQILHYRLYQYDRSAFLDLDMPALDRDAELWVEPGQTVASMRGSTLDMELAERSTALADARGQLLSLKGSAKPEEIEKAQVARQRAVAALADFRPQYDRVQDLRGQGVATQQEWDEAVAHFNLLSLDIRLAEAQEAVLASGDQPEKIERVKMSIAALEEELRTVEAMLGAQQIRSPIAGRLRVGGAMDRLLSVSTQDSMIIQIFIPQHMAALPREGHRFSTYLPGALRRPPSGEVIRVDRNATITEAGSFVTVYGLLPNPDRLLVEGMQGRSRLHCGKTTLLKRIWQDIQRTARQELWTT